MATLEKGFVEHILLVVNLTMFVFEHLLYLNDYFLIILTFYIRLFTVFVFII